MVAAVVVVAAAVSATIFGPTEQAHPQGAPPVDFIPRGGTCAPLDVAFLIDSTGSMAPAIANVQAEITGFLGEIEEASGGDYRIALVDFGLGVNVRVPFSPSNRDAVADAVPSLADGGGSTPEAWDEALVTAVEGRATSDVPTGDQQGDFSGGWRSEANKLVVLVTDAPAAGFDDSEQPADLALAQEAAREASRQGIRVTTVFVPNVNADRDAAPQLTDVAGLGGGVYFETAEDGANLTDGLDLAVRTCGADTDGDGLFDNWETEGIDSDGDGIVDLDLPGMGADPEHKDLFVEVDWMTAPTFATCWHLVWCPATDDLAPDPAALQKMAEAFARAPVDNPDGDAGITLHIDAGARTPSVGGIDSRYRRGGPLDEGDYADPLITESIDVDIDTAAYDEAMTPFDAFHDRSVDDIRRVAFTWVLYTDHITSSNGLLGLARGIPADSVMIAGAVMDSTPKEAATVMHEIGHTLSLRHGGEDGLHNKPNYLSIMNYAHALRNGLVVDGQADVIDYSAWDLPPIDESDLDETAGMAGDNGEPRDVRALHPCRPTEPQLDQDMQPFFVGAPVDWNCDGDTTDRGLSTPVRAQRGRSTAPEVMTSWNDWDHLSFTGGVRGGLGTASGEVPVEDGFDEENYVATPKDHAVSVVGGGAVQAVPGARDLAFPIDLVNIGTEADRYTISADGPDGTDPALTAEAIGLTAGETGDVTLSVDVPDDAELGDELTVTAQLTSEATQESVATVIVTITVVAEADESTDGSLSVTPDPVRAGETIAASGDGFAPGSPVIVWTEPSVGDPLDAVADDDGRFSVEIAVPSDRDGTLVVHAGGYEVTGEPPSAPALPTDRPDRGAPRVLTRSVEVVPKPGSLLRFWPYAAVGVALAGLVLGLYLVLRRRDRGGGSTPGDTGPTPEPGPGPEPEITLYDDLDVRLVPDRADDDVEVRLR